MIDQGQLFHTDNPCRSICAVNNKGFCKGCFRSREERFHWHDFTEYQKHLVVQMCQVREKRVEAARRKRLQQETQQVSQFDLFEQSSVDHESALEKKPFEDSTQLSLF